MKFPVWTRWAIALSLLVFASSRLRIPLPTFLVDRLLAEQAPEFSLGHGKQWLRWGSGEIVVEDFDLAYRGESVLRAARVAVALDLWPGSADFGMPALVEVDQPIIRADLALVDALTELFQRLFPPDRPMRTPPTMRLQVRDLAVEVIDAAGDRWACDAVQVDGHMEPGAGARVQLSGDTLAPFPGSFALHAEGDGTLLRWRGNVETELGLRPALEPLRALDWDWSGGPLRLQASVEADPDGLHALRTRLDVRLGRVAGRSLPVEVSDLHLALEGDARRGFVLDASGREARGAVTARATLRAPAPPAEDSGSEEAAPDALRLDADALAAWSLRSTLDAKEALADDAAVAWLGSLAPSLQSITAALDSLGLRGTAALQSGIDYSPSQGWHWALRVDPRVVGMNYRGFVEPDGRRIAVPYPVTDVAGIMMTGGSALVYDARARAGTAQVVSRGSFDFRERGQPGLDLTLSAVGLTLDRQAAHALSGNPEIAALWREAGSPLGGTLDLDLRLRDDRDGFRAAISGQVRGASGAPLSLPVQTAVEDASFTVRGGVIDFRGRIAALGSALQVNGTLRERADGGHALELLASGYGLQPGPGERLALQHYLRFPAELADINVSGDLRYDLALRMPDITGEPHVLVSLDLGGAACTERALELDIEDLRGTGTLASGRGGLGVFLPAVQMRIPGGEASGSVVVHPAAERREATLETGPVRVDEDLSARLRRLVGLEVWGGGIGLSGTVRIRGAADPMRPETFRGVLQCEPLVISADDDLQRETFQVEGDVQLARDRVRATRLHLTGNDTDLWVRDCDLRISDNGDVVLDARLDSVSGVLLSSNLPLLVGPDALAALRALGLDGRARPRALALRLQSFAGSSVLTLSGDLLVDGIAIRPGPGAGLRDGSATLRVDDASWSSSDDFHGRVQVTEAQGSLAGMRVKDGTGTLLLNQRSVRLVGFEAAMLGGRVVSDFQDRDGVPVAGELALGLEPDGPVHLRFAGRDLALDRMREELRTGGSLSGLLDVEIDLSGSAARSTSLLGGGVATIRDGVLGTVPVLKNIWAVAGVRPPVFERGMVRFQANGLDRVEIDELVLEHKLMDVRGKGYIRFDSGLHLKVTVRTFGAFGDLPILSDILDWLVEQDVRGPIERPVIYQRSTSKLFNTEPFVPFPLWVLPPPQPDWRRSPIVPVVPMPVAEALPDAGPQP